MKQILIIISTALLIILSGCSSSNNPSNDLSYDEIYDEGYNDGYDIGDDEGEQNVYNEFGYGDYSQMSNAMEKYDWVLDNLVFIPSGTNTYHRLDCDLVPNQNVKVMFFDGANNAGYQLYGQCSYYE